MEKAATALANIVIQTVNAPLIILFYTILLSRSINWYAPLLVLGYFVIAYVVNKFLMGPVTNYTYKQEKYEGDFRYNHVRLRTHAESIALYSGGQEASWQLNAMFHRLIENTWNVATWNFALNGMQSVLLRANMQAASTFGLTWVEYSTTSLCASPSLWIP